jgi:hypothetical protein
MADPSTLKKPSGGGGGRADDGGGKGRRGERGPRVGVDPFASLDDVLRQTKDGPLVVQQVSGSTAGSGSGDFHQYRMARRTERNRLSAMEREFRIVCALRSFFPFFLLLTLIAALQQTKEKEEYEAKRAEAMAEAEARTAKLAAKRKYVPITRICWAPPSPMP